MSDEVLDYVFCRILDYCDGSHEEFLDLIFSFLYRRTYFFKSNHGSSGFFPEEMVEMICRRYQQLETEKENALIYENQNDMISESENDMISESENDMTSEFVYVQECREEIVETTEFEPDCDVSDTSISEYVSLVDKLSCHEISQEEDTPLKENYAETDADVLKTYYDSNPECYNGASYDNYSWSQTIHDLDVQIKVPDFVTNGKQVRVQISHTHLKAEVLKSNEWEVVLHGQLSLKINTEGSVWTLDPGHHIHVHLEKAQEQFWDALLVGEPKINVQTIDCSKPYEELREEEQAKIQEVLYDHHQKKLGKPTIKETRVHQILREAWNKENSPFKGQKFDLDNFSIME